MIEDARWADADKAGITCTLDGVPGAFIPAGHYLLDGFEDEVAAYVPPENAPQPVPAVISDRQFAQVLALDGTITQDEALAWAARGDLPKAMADALAKIPEANGQRFGARMLLAAATTYERHHPLTPQLGALLGYDAAALDDIWTRGAAL